MWDAEKKPKDEEKEEMEEEDLRFLTRGMGIPFCLKLSGPP